ncbi:MAG: hypothetical protein MI924_20405, partial [Chloroflexales bacterium]|nr:hypothetical protein [Chloroflexales bacterium]
MLLTLHRISRPLTFVVLLCLLVGTLPPNAAARDPVGPTPPTAPPDPVPVQAGMRATPPPPRN